MDLVLGIDGGQSTTTAAICELTGRLLGVGRAGPANHISEPGGILRAQRTVRACIAEAAREAGLRRASFRAAFLGMTGGHNPLWQVVRDCVTAEQFRVDNDQVTALACVTAGGPGVVVIAGTGSIAYGENARGRSTTVSGWGYLLGDEGSGFWIAKQAITAATRAWDGRTGPTRLTETLLAAAGVTDLWDLHGQIYSGRRSRAEVAALAVAVPEAAALGDATGRRILRTAGEELGLAAVTVARQLRMAAGAVSVGMVGGVFRGSPEVRRAFRRAVAKEVSRAEFAEPRVAPVIGSVLLALKMARVRITPAVFENLAAASARVGAK